MTVSMETILFLPLNHTFAGRTSQVIHKDVKQTKSFQSDIIFNILNPKIVY